MLAVRLSAAVPPRPADPAAVTGASPGGTRPAGPQSPSGGRPRCLPARPGGHKGHREHHRPWGLDGGARPLCPWQRHALGRRRVGSRRPVGAPTSVCGREVPAVRLRPRLGLDPDPLRLLDSRLCRCSSTGRWLAVALGSHSPLARRSSERRWARPACSRTQGLGETRPAAGAAAGAAAAPAPSRADALPGVLRGGEPRRVVCA